VIFPNNSEMANSQNLPKQQKELTTVPMKLFAFNFLILLVHVVGDCTNDINECVNELSNCSDEVGTSVELFCTCMDKYYTCLLSSDCSTDEKKW
jgi:hypothetical protein